MGNTPTRGRRVMLVISYVAWTASPRRTVEEFGQALSQLSRLKDDSVQVVLGVDAHSEDPWTELRPLQNLFAEIYVWSKPLTQAVTERPLSVSEARPFFPSFSYGGFLNQAFILATYAECDYVLRVDPGTAPPEELGEILIEHFDTLDSESDVEVVSGQYQDRLAYRDRLYRHDTNADEYLRFVGRFTGVDLRKQVTGGAMFTATTPGVPAMPFEMFTAASGKQEPTLVWGSDDALFQLHSPPTLPCGRVFLEHAVPRFDPVGKAKLPEEYFRGVAGMVYLRTLLERRRSRESVSRFIAELNPYLSPDRPECRDPNNPACTLLPLRLADVAPALFLDKIDIGHANYTRLCRDWTEIVPDVANTIQSIDSGDQVVVKMS